MDNHHDHHEETKPSNKWVATPILLAFITIAALVTFLSLSTRTCCEGECKDKAKTEEHGGDHGTTTDDHVGANDHSEEVKSDTTKTTSDTTATNESHEGHGDQNEGEGHGH